MRLFNSCPTLCFTLLAGNMLACKQPTTQQDGQPLSAARITTLTVVGPEAYLKTQPVSWGQLDEEDRCLLAQRQTYSLTRVIESRDKHHRVEFEARPTDDCEMIVGWVFEGDVLIEGQ